MRPKAETTVCFLFYFFALGILKGQQSGFHIPLQITVFSTVVRSLRGSVGKSIAKLLPDTDIVQATNTDYVVVSLCLSRNDPMPDARAIVLLFTCLLQIASL